MSARRGYIMIEVMVGGAMVAVLIGGLLVNIAQGRTRNVLAGRDVIASQLVMGKIEAARGEGFTGAAAACTAGNGVVAGQNGEYTLTCATSGGSETIAGVSVDFVDLNVTVTYESSLGQRSINAVSRVYDYL